MYSYIKKILFSLDPEIAHEFTLQSLRLLTLLGIDKLCKPMVSKPCEVMGLRFSNPLGLAAGLDKNGDFIDALAALGFGFIEIGSITPKPQSGNPKPRLFRLVKEQAIINRMGFNNKGVDYLIERLKKTKYQGILGINIGKNRDTPIENALDDYLFVLQRVLPYASYVTINLSSPNTEKLRDLQHGELLRSLLKNLKLAQAEYMLQHKKYVPLVVKISPDLTQAELAEMAEIFLSEKVDGVIATNTTLSRLGVENSSFVKESGGLSGKPLFTHSTQIIKQLNELLQNKIPIIGCGGIFSPEDAKEKVAAGASLIQLYTGLIYQGPDLIRSIVSQCP